jgi:glycosyltransferase involved in cell wall biosynthesis
MEAAREFKPTFVYQRLTGGDWSGAEVADALGIPLVAEYNGSELWMSKNWGRKVRCAAEIQMAEEAMLKRADLVFTVSQPLCDELLARDVAPGRVAWYPNCVDPAIYNPEAIPEAVRTATRGQLGAETNDFVFLFLGTFGLWHGAEVFARAAALLARDSEWMRRTRVRFAFVGDGKTRPQCQEIIHASPAAARTEFTGLVAQHEAPRFLAAADAFVSPHVPNADGSRFFGSPTKLFEYMAMTRPIVASALDQIADVLEDGRTAVLVKPGDVEALAAGLRRVVEDRTLGARLGAAARAEVLAKYTWSRHVSVMLDALERACVTDARKGGE